MPHYQVTLEFKMRSSIVVEGLNPIDAAESAELYAAKFAELEMIPEDAVVVSDSIKADMSNVVEVQVEKETKSDKS